MGAALFSSDVRKYLVVGFRIIWIVTHEEQRALNVLRAISSRFSVWSATQGLEPNTPELRNPVDAIEHILTAEGRGLYVFLDVHPFLSNPLLVRALRDFAERSPERGQAIILISPSTQIPEELEKDTAVVDPPLPTFAELNVLLGDECKEASLPEVDVEPLVRAAPGLAWLEAQRAFRLAFRCSDMAEAVHHVVREKRRVMRRSGVLDFVEHDVSLDNVGGLEGIKVWLRSRVAAFRDKARAFGLPEPRGMLVCGVQGCGKSLVAKAAAVVFGLPLVRFDFVSVFASPRPESAFQQATRIVDAIAPLVLWVDEIEKGLSGIDSTHSRVFGDFLVWLQEKKASVFVAATANEVERLPPELARRGRFDEVFFVDLPAAKEREEILAIHLRQRNRDPSLFALSKLAKDLEQFSGAEIEQVVISGLFRAFGAGRDLNVDDLRVAASEIVPLSQMYEEKVQALRSWAKTRARRASADRRTLELFED